jgi:hypothetical protein
MCQEPFYGIVPNETSCGMTFTPGAIRGVTAGIDLMWNMNVHCVLILAIEIRMHFTTRSGKSLVGSIGESSCSKDITYYNNISFVNDITVLALNPYI